MIVFKLIQYWINLSILIDQDRNEIINLILNNIEFDQIRSIKIKFFWSNSLSILIDSKQSEIDSMHYLDIVETLEGYRKEGWGGGQGGVEGEGKCFGRIG